MTTRATHAHNVMRLLLMFALFASLLAACTPPAPDIARRDLSTVQPLWAIDQFHRTDEYVLDGDQLFLLGTNQQANWAVVALDSATGQTQWTFTEAINGVPHLLGRVEDVVVLGWTTFDGVGLVGLEATTGAERWREAIPRENPEMIVLLPRMLDDLIPVTIDYNLWSVRDGATGAELRRVELPYYGEYEDVPPQVDVHPTKTQGLFALNDRLIYINNEPAIGSLNWRTGETTETLLPLPGTYPSSNAEGHGYTFDTFYLTDDLYLTTREGPTTRDTNIPEAYLLRADGTIVWGPLPFPPVTRISHVQPDQNLFWISDTTVASLATGEILWDRPRSSGMGGNQFDGRNAQVIEPFDGPPRLQTVAMADGTDLISQPLPDVPERSYFTDLQLPQGANTLLAAVTKCRDVESLDLCEEEESTLFALDPVTLQVRWRYTAQSLYLKTASDTLVIAEADGKVLAFRP